MSVELVFFSSFMQRLFATVIFRICHGNLGTGKEHNEKMCDEERDSQ